MNPCKLCQKSGQTYVLLAGKKQNIVLFKTILTKLQLLLADNLVFYRTWTGGTQIVHIVYLGIDGIHLWLTRMYHLICSRSGSDEDILYCLSG